MRTRRTSEAHLSGNCLETAETLQGAQRDIFHREEKKTTLLYSLYHLLSLSVSKVYSLALSLHPSLPLALTCRAIVYSNSFSLGTKGKCHYCSSVLLFISLLISLSAYLSLCLSLSPPMLLSLSLLALSVIYWVSSRLGAHNHCCGKLRLLSSPSFFWRRHGADQLNTLVILKYFSTRVATCIYGTTAGSCAPFCS